MARIIIPLQCKEAGKKNCFQGAKDYIKKIVRSQLKHPGFGLYLKYDVEQDVITFWSTLPSDDKKLLEVLLDSYKEIEKREACFQSVAEAETKGKKFSDKKLEDLTRDFSIKISGPLLEDQMFTCFKYIDKRFEQWIDDFEKQAKRK